MKETSTYLILGKNERAAELAERVVGVPEEEDMLKQEIPCNQRKNSFE